MRPPKDQSPIAAVARQMRERELETRSIVLFLLLLSAFLAILILRAHLLAPVDPNRVIGAAATLPSAVAAKSLPLRPGF